jgi:hypothetical protein
VNRRFGALALAAGVVAAALTQPVAVADPGHDHGRHAAKKPSRLATQLARARVATAPYVDDLQRAKADGYQIITPMMRNMGYHFLNPAVTGFDVTKPPILVYTRRGNEWQLGALEWVFPAKPDKKPLKGARYGSFPAACHYEDGTFIPVRAETDCPATHPDTSSPFTFWHGDLVTLHVWLWYPNPDGLYAGTNPLVAPFNRG